jgi:transposase
MKSIKLRGMVIEPADKITADKAYNSKDFRNAILRAGKKCVIPPRSNHKSPPFFDKEDYRNRNKVERGNQVISQDCNTIR